MNNRACTGRSTCTATRHIHGCFADNPCQHESTLNVAPVSDPVLPPDPTFVDEIEALAAETTPGPWYSSGVGEVYADLKTICEGSIVEAALIARVPEMVSALRAQAETIETLTRLVEDAERLIRREVPSGRWPMFWFSNVKRARLSPKGRPMPTDRTELDVAADAVFDDIESTVGASAYSDIARAVLAALGVPLDAPEGTIAACLELGQLFFRPNHSFDTMNWLHRLPEPVRAYLGRQP